MEFPFPSLLIKPKRQISFRNLKNINSDCLTADLQHFLSINTSSINEPVDFYNKTLGSILDIHAPVRVRTVIFSRSAPWFTSELRRMKAAGRVIERRNKSGLTVHRLAYREHQRAYSKSLKEAQSQFYSNIIQKREESRDPTKMAA